MDGFLKSIVIVKLINMTVTQLCGSCDSSLGWRSGDGLIKIICT